MPADKTPEMPKLNRAQRRRQGRRPRDRSAPLDRDPRAPRPEPRGGRRWSSSSRHRGKK